jgi:hypothetical protein
VADTFLAEPLTLEAQALWLLLVVKPMERAVLYWQVLVALAVLETLMTALAVVVQVDTLPMAEQVEQP